MDARLHQEWVKACEERALQARAEALRRSHEFKSAIDDRDLPDFEPDLPPDEAIRIRKEQEALAARLEALKALRGAVYRRDRGRCWLCGYPVKPASQNMEQCATLDHVIPCALGGTDDISNLRLAHKYCNGYRDRMSPRKAWEGLRQFARGIDPTLTTYWRAPARTFHLPKVTGT